MTMLIIEIIVITLTCFSCGALLAFGIYGLYFWVFGRKAARYPNLRPEPKQWNDGMYIHSINMKPPESDYVVMQQGSNRPICFECKLIWSVSQFNKQVALEFDVEENRAVFTYTQVALEFDVEENRAVFTYTEDKITHVIPFDCIRYAANYTLFKFLPDILKDQEPDMTFAYVGWNEDHGKATNGMIVFYNKEFKGSAYKVHVFDPDFIQAIK